MNFNQKLQAAKQFVPSLKKKNQVGMKAALQAVYITPEYIYATDSYSLIRIKHNEDIKESYLHEFKPNNDSSRYPTSGIERLFPDMGNEHKSYEFDVAEWRQAHEAGYVAAKVDKKNTKIELDGRLLKVRNDEIGFTHNLVKDTGIQAAYNCEYMIKALKALKKFKVEKATIMQFKRHQPLWITSDEVDFLIMPIRTW